MIRGTRISVELILDVVVSGWTMEDVLESYPHLEPEDVVAALSFAAELFREQREVAIAKAAEIRSMG